MRSKDLRLGEKAQEDALALHPSLDERVDKLDQCPAFEDGFKVAISSNNGFGIWRI